MQNNVTEITQRLLRSLDNNYNVVDMPAVVEIISVLEKVAITKELLETTRLGKYVNELRKKTSNDSLSKRAKELVKKWKNMVLPTTPATPQPAPPEINGQTAKRKRENVDNSATIPTALKRSKNNGQVTTTSEYEFSDNSNSSFKDVINSKTSIATVASNRVNELKSSSNVIVINSDSNRNDPQIDQQLPKKRGRKKGSKNHKNLVDEAESSFTNKLAVSRGNSKVKTTQELIASLQNKSNQSLALPQLGQVKSKEDLSERAAKLTERVSIIDKTLYTNSNRSKQKNRYSSKLSFGDRNDRVVIESGSVINDKSLNSKGDGDDEEIIVVDDMDAGSGDDAEEEKPEVQETQEQKDRPPCLTTEEILAQLPPIDTSTLEEPEEDHPAWCSCYLKECNAPNKSDFSVVEDEPEPNDNDAAFAGPKYEFIIDSQCRAKTFYASKYRMDDVYDENRVDELSRVPKPNVNGNLTLNPNDERVENDENHPDLYTNVVPNVYNECKLKSNTNEMPCENFKKYSISEEKIDGERTEDVVNDNKRFEGFAEWHECVETPSYNGEILKILPYVVID